MTGLHAPDSPFADVSWMDDPSGRWDDPRGWSVEWKSVPTGSAHIRAYAFDLVAVESEALTFGTAVDPDIGHSAGDDMAVVDPSGLVVVWDPDGAVGLLLLSGRRSALQAVRQYGVRESAPRDQRRARDQYRTGNTRMLGDPDDVQLLLRVDDSFEGTRWEFVVIRGKTPTEVRERAAEYLR